MLDWHINLALEHQKEMLREAEQHYQLKLATSAARNPFGVRSRGMVWLGCKLVELGRSLQARGGFSISPIGPSRITPMSSTSFGIGLPHAGITYLADARRSEVGKDGTYDCA